MQYFLYEIYSNRTVMLDGLRRTKIIISIYACIHTMYLVN